MADNPQIELEIANDTGAPVPVVDSRLPSTLGQKTMANSLAVVLASDQSPIPISLSVNRPQTFSLHANNVAIGNGKSMVSLFNAGGSSVVLRIVSIKIINVQNTGVTGIVANFGLRKISTHSGGTQLTTTGAAAGLIFPYDSTNSLDGSVTVRTGATVTESIAFSIEDWTWSSDEWGAGPADTESFDHALQQLIAVWVAQANSQPLTLRAGEGFHILQTINSTAGTFDFIITFTQE